MQGDFPILCSLAVVVMNDTEWKMKCYNKQIAFTHLCAHMLYVVFL